MKRFLFIDTETTGLPADWKAPITNTNNWPRLVQIAWILTDKFGETLNESEYIIYPTNFLIPKESTQIHRITDSIAKQKGVLIDRVLQELNSHIENADCIVAHNLNFDEKIIGAEFYRNKIETKLFNKHRICTMEGATKFCAIPSTYGYKWPTLAELHAKLYGEDFFEAHNALSS